jgi:hypothetical protein
MESGGAPLSSCIVLLDRVALKSFFWHITASILVKRENMRKRENFDDGEVALRVQTSSYAKASLRHSERETALYCSDSHLVLHLL